MQVLQQLFKVLPLQRLLGVGSVQYFSEKRQKYIDSSAVVHALSSPLTVLFLALDEFYDSHSTSSQQQAKQKISAARDRIWSLYQVWRGEVSHSKRFLVKQAVISTVQMTAVPKNCSIHTKFSIKHTLKLLGNVVLFEEMLLCLLRNAAESYNKNDIFMPVICSVTQTTTQLQIDIIDSGTGMNQVALAVAGVYGFSFKTSGTGIGLSLARKIAREHFAGSLLISSRPGLGTRVSLLLPLDRSIAKPTNCFK